jgi:hypothetical protein
LVWLWYPDVLSPTNWGGESYDVLTDTPASVVDRNVLKKEDWAVMQYNGFYRELWLTSPIVTALLTQFKNRRFINDSAILLCKLLRYSHASCAKGFYNSLIWQISRISKLSAVLFPHLA